MPKKLIFIISLIMSILFLLAGNVAAQATSTPELEHKGLIEAKPANGNLGEWLIGGLSFTTTANTQFDTEDGPLEVGVCAEVEYLLQGDQKIALKIESESEDDCTNATATATPSGTPSATVTETATSTPEVEYKGIIEAKPADGNQGEWLIGGSTFTTTVNTEFRIEDGPLEIGVCAEVEYIIDGDKKIALKIESESPDDCDEVALFELKGLIGEKPIEGGAGTWLIAGIAFEATANTIFRLDEGALAVGVCVEVEYLIQNNQNIAKKIASKNSDDCATSSIHSQKGKLSALPAAGLIGLWIIDGVDYMATSTTIFEQSDGPFAIGACVEIEFVRQNDQNIALSIKTDDDCDNNGGLSPNEKESKGIIDSLPEGLIGLWVVDGLEYTATINTEFDHSHGDFSPGMCVEIEYIEVNSLRQALEIESESADDCGGSGEEENFETKALLEALPEDGLIGTWLIGGQAYTSTAQTRFDQGYGAFEIGTCLEVRYRLEGDERIATKIKSKRSHSCYDNDDGDDDDYEAYGLIEALPTDGGLGVWMIGGLPYLISDTTKLEHGPFVIGLLVKVHFVPLPDGTLLATKVEGKHKVHDNDIHSAKAYGVVEMRPDNGSIGLWKISGITYTATAQSKFDDDAGEPVVGACVKVRYRVKDNRNLLFKIETEDLADCLDDTGNALNRAIGFIEDMPAQGFVGAWVVAGNIYEVTTATEIEEGHGILTLSAFVKIKYTIKNGVRLVHKIETHVPPNVGKINVTGKLKTNPNRLSLSANTLTWLVNGQAYTILDVTLLEDSYADLVDGQQVQLNAYDQEGELIATKVTALSQVYLPMVIR